MCTGAVGALANYIERAGVATTSISLVREQSEAVNPPRALWVPYALGRPLGSASDPDFQKQVLRAAFALLDDATQPTIKDHDVDAPDEVAASAWSCPITFPVPQDDSLAGRLAAEVDRLRPWAMQTRSERGRTLFGVTGANAEQVDEVTSALAEIAETGNLVDAPDSDINWAFDMPLLVRHLVDDTRTFYHEAIAAQPGAVAPNHSALNDWIFGGTALGDVLQAIAAHLTNDGSPLAALVRGLIVPEGYFNGGSAFPVTSEFGATT